jgi:TonB family protein
LFVCLFASPALAQANASGGSSEEARKFNTQAVALYKEGKYEEAIRQQKQAIALWEKELGKENKLIANGFTNLAEMYRAVRRYDEAANAYQRALKIEEKLSGPEHANLVALLIKLGWMRHGVAQGAEAEALFKRSVAIVEKEGENHPALADSLLNLAAFYQKTGRPAIAVGTYERVIAIQEKNYGAEAELLVNTLEQCACALRLIKKPLDASKMEQRAAIIERKTKPDITSVEGGVLQGYAIHKEAPPYPPAAKAERLSGSVFIKVLIDEDGKVIDANILCGADLLAVSAREAALKWRFKPSAINGRPTKVTGILTFNFAL